MPSNYMMSEVEMRSFLQYIILLEICGVGMSVHWPQTYTWVL